MPRDGELDHLAPGFAGRDHGIEFVRRLSGGNEPDLVELALLPTLLGQHEMAVVNRVERTAVDAKSHESIARLAAG